MLITVNDLLKVKGDSVWSVSPATSVIDTLKTMADKDVGALLVLEDSQIAGIISERDIVRKIAATTMCQLESPIKNYMTHEVFTIHPTQSIAACMEIMTEKHIRHLPVVEDDKVVGLISIGDVIKAIITSQEFTIDQLEKYISGGAYNQ